MIEIKQVHKINNIVYSRRKITYSIVFFYKQRLKFKNWKRRICLKFKN